MRIRSRTNRLQRGFAAPAAALILLITLPILFRKPATTIRRTELFTELVSRLAESEEVRNDWTASELDSLLSQVASGLMPLPGCAGSDLAAGLGSIYPTRFLYVYEPKSGSLFIAAALTGSLVQRECETLSGSYEFTFAGRGDISFYLLMTDSGSGWPGLAFTEMSAAF